MLTSPDIKLFSAGPAKTQATRKRALFGGLRVLGSAQIVFLRETLIIVDIVSLIFVFLIVSTLYEQHSSTEIIIGVEAFFLASLVLLLIARKSVHFAAVLACDAAILVLNVLLNVLFQGDWGNFGLLAICGYTCYRLPLRWAWPLVAASCIALAATNGLNELILTRHLSNGSPLVTPLLIAVFLCWTSWTRRSRDLLVLELQETQEQLRREMAHTEELAVTRERARIARDIHDVLAHSLTVLSIQVQAARQLVQQHPERLAAKLDDIATLLRESIAESRHVVGLLRETATPNRAHGDVGKRLQAVVDRFCERTGIHCLFEENGTAQRIGDEQTETLQYALQEALTNAHRHGPAQHIWVDLRWHDARVTLQVQDDGQGQGSIEQYNGTHHGLQGMRERATTLGGELQAGPQPDGGFVIALTLPLGRVDRSWSQEGEHERT